MGLAHGKQEDTRDSGTKDAFDFEVGKFEDPCDSVAASACVLAAETCNFAREGASEPTADAEACDHWNEEAEEPFAETNAYY